MSEKKLSGGVVNKAATKSDATPTKATKPAAPPRPAPARALDQGKQALVAQKREALRAKQATLKAAKPAAAAPTAPDAATTSRLTALQTRFNDLQDDILLTSVHDDMGRVEAVLTTLASDLAQLRGQGYVFSSFLENKVNVLTDKWETLYDTMGDAVEQQGDTLERDARAAQRLVQGAVAQPSTLVQAEAAVQRLEQGTNAARTALNGRYRDVAQTIQDTRSHLDRIRRAMEQAAGSEIPWLPGEFMVAATVADLLEGPEDKDPEEGILFLTDERLIFEQREKRATKKFLFLTTASETVQEVLLAEPLGHVEGVEAQDARHFLSSRQLLTVRFASGARVRAVTFHVKEGATNEEWVALLHRVGSGEIERERLASVAGEKEAASAQVAQAPTVCGTCGGHFPAALPRGVASLSCEYCGAVTRIG